MRIAVIDTGAGNLASVLRAFRRAAGEAGLAAAIDVTTRPEDVAAAMHYFGASPYTFPLGAPDTRI